MSDAEIQPANPAPQEEAPKESAQSGPFRPSTPAYLNSLPIKTSDERHWPNAESQSVNVGGYVMRRAGYEGALIMKRFEDVTTAYHTFKYVPL